MAKKAFPNIYRGNVEVGGTILFGRYPQATDKPEPIAWRVLSKEENRCTAISIWGLDIQPYHNCLEPVSWEKCSLRAWLHNSFLATAFTPEEQRMLVEKDPWALENSLLPSKLQISGPPDKVSILSYQEAKSFYRSRSDHESCTARLAYPTPFAVKRGDSKEGFVWDRLRNHHCCDWWLRMPGVSTQTKIVTPIGDFSHVSGWDVDDDYHAVRPVIVLRCRSV